MISVEDRKGAVERLRHLQTAKDREEAHIEADRILCELLRKLGQNDVVAEFEKIEKWFA